MTGRPDCAQFETGSKHSLSAAAAVLVGILTGCGSSSPSGLPLNGWLSHKAGQRAVTVTLVPGYNDVYNGFNFNGYGKGEVLVSVPRGWRVTVRCENTRSKERHSCAVVRGAGSARPAFPGAASPNPRAGLAAGQSASFSFTADALGTYRLACLVAEHERAGEWDVLEVTRTRLPAVRLLRAPS
ncbi:MAG: sulfocyanin-like copper-binding protein [Gaiellaceae bacterium]